ncbi:MAG: acyl-CoA dehydrogenase [Microcystis aeruginosa Ma_MB_F_20061100_S19]|uniref:Acyl-CoA dehydrogenase, short-chain specific n=1 Tax=Microcystis aeruginosa SPC777 TaxID=482300 RepID=S3IXL4_MICAE|nr:acyl-CoA dehydrogenase family protein [Microcystis aeruginosa]NCR99733.1 acyl-CoA dehydrogenase family protein [Microcystis aeruginosa L311-01]OCY12165.1 MAG: isovaleryl-CoA dehydrogenase [Microcystis aeruginosa CACIAM 03]TRU08881.1 MAG: acyl-CoA dehydrogenase [Microcystis aeruginosa Ma_MB_F_20061100_S19]TRU15235.1 MAG: acyl-CoA dehydrogenase [Microcystis aeruginosa Ma_MB_F_20061100_S19D]EPF17655.1 Acyl-CoA dehydrogenase, short-chain specific [Microcystis aeruginosa SPC777]
MKKLKQYWTAEALEKDLGDPLNPDNPLSYKRVIEIDESEEFPHEEIRWLYDWKLQHYYIPTDCGGEFTSFEEFVAFVRVLSRRDQTIGIAFTTLFWSFLNWMAGTPEQKQKLARFIMDDYGAMCLGYSEKEHGSDLINGDLTATKVEGGYILNGEKWPINRATISGISFILAKTDANGGPKCLTLFMVDKRQLDPEKYYNLPKIYTHGVRASDMSGIGFKDCFVPDSMRLREEGDGLELALKGFQITRMLCAAFSHGAADTALRTTLGFAVNRVIYNKNVMDLPQPRRTLVDAFLDILICDCETIPAARGFHIIPEQFSVWASVVKYFVTVRLEEMVNSVYVVLGSRFYMREEHEFGIFQKLLRDNSIISMFDGSSIVNLHALILQLRPLTKYRAKRNSRTMSALKTRLEAIFSLEKSVPPFEPNNLELFGRGMDDSLQGLEIALDILEGLKNSDEVDPEILENLLMLGNLVLEELNAHDEKISQSKFEYGHDQSPELFEIARKYCTLHAASACLHTWLYNRSILGEFFARGEWLVLSLHRLLRTLRPLPYTLSEVYVENVAQELLKLYQENQHFSIVPFQLAHSQTTEEKTHELQLQS